MPKKFDNLYYAFGGGLGHLSRCMAFIHTQCLNPATVLIVTASKYTHYFPEVYQFQLVSMELENQPEKIEKVLNQYIIEYEITTVFIDSFPGGLFGEWTDFSKPEISVNYIARLLNFERYKGILNASKLRFTKTFIIEMLEEEHIQYISKNSLSIEYITLQYPNFDISNELQTLISTCEKPLWLIAHSENDEEVEILVNQAIEISKATEQKPTLIISTTIAYKTHYSPSIVIQHFPIYPIFPTVDKIFTACGFNLMSQTIQFAEKHYFIPFPRKFDNQFFRAQERRKLAHQIPINTLEERL